MQQAVRIGHLRKKTCQIQTIQYNYLGRQSQMTYSYNNKRLLTSIAGPALINITYDNMDRPITGNNWQNTTLNPFYQEIFRGSIEEYIPIPQNNIIHYTIYHSFRGAPLRSDEFFYTYQYDDYYPVTQSFLRLTFNPFIPGFVDSTQGVNYYTYDCVGGDGKNGK